MAYDALSRLIEKFERQEEAAKTANLQRYGEIMNIMDEMIARARPGGAFERRGLEEIRREKVKGVGRETQQLISSGLYGTTTMAGTGRRWEAEVGAPARTRLEDIMEQKLSAAQMAKAGAIERREDIGPDYGMIAQLASQVGQRTAGARMRMPSTRIQKPLFQDFPALKTPYGGGDIGPTTTARSPYYYKGVPAKQYGPLRKPTPKLTRAAKQLFTPGAGWREW